MVVRTQMATSANATSYVGDVGEKIAVWGGQFYIGSLKNYSYMPATGSSVTRALDLFTSPAANFATWFRQDAFTFVFDFYGQTVGTCIYWEFHNTTSNERFLLVSIDGVLTFFIVVGGVNQCSIALGNVVTGAFYSVAAAWALNDIAACVNGGTVGTDTSAALATVTTAHLGSNYAGVGQMNGEIGRFKGYPERLPNAELQGLTL